LSIRSRTALAGLRGRGIIGQAAHFVHAAGVTGAVELLLRGRDASRA